MKAEQFLDMLADVAKQLAPKLAEIQTQMSEEEKQCDEVDDVWDECNVHARLLLLHAEVVDLVRVIDEIDERLGEVSPESGRSLTSESRRLINHHVRRVDNRLESLEEGGLEPLSIGRAYCEKCDHYYTVMPDEQGNVVLQVHCHGCATNMTVLRCRRKEDEPVPVPSPEAIARMAKREQDLQHALKDIRQQLGCKAAGTIKGERSRILGAIEHLQNQVADAQN